MLTSSGFLFLGFAYKAKNKTLAGASHGSFLL